MPDENQSKPGFDDEILEAWRMKSGIDVEELSRSEFVEHVAAGDLEGEEAQNGVRMLIDRGDDGDAQTLVSELEAVAEDGDRDCQIAVGRILAHIASTHPDAVSAAAPLLVDMAASDSVSLRNFAIAALAEIADERPAAVRDAVPTLSDSLDSLYSNERRGAAQIAAAVSRGYPEDVASVVPGLVDALAPRRDRENAAETIAEQFTASAAEPSDSRHGEETEMVGERELPTGVADPYKLEREAEYGETVRHGIQQEHAAVAIANVASHDPGRVLPHLSTLLELLEVDTTAEAREAVLNALYPLAEHDPETLLPTADVIANQLTAESEATRAAAARVLALFGGEDVECVAAVTIDAVPRVVDLLAADAPWIRGAGANLLAYVAEVAPDQVRPAIDDVAALLDDDAMFVRGSAVSCLSYLEGETARAALRETAESDPDRRVRLLADEALSEPR